MNKKIYIFGLHEEKCSYAIFDQNHLLEKSIIDGNFSDIHANESDEIILVLSQRAVLLKHVILPKLNYQKLMQALPFSLEENLIDDIHTLHFAVGTYQTEYWPCAIVAIKVMDYWYQLLLQHNLTPSFMIPAVLTLPFTDEEWSIAIFQNEALVRTGKWDGFSCDIENLSVLLNLKLNEVITKPITIHCHIYSEKNLVINIENIPIQNKQFPSKQFMIDIANRIENVPTINLFQGNYQPKTQISKIKKTWVLSGIILGIAILIGFLGNLISLFILEQQSSHLHSAIKSIYQQTFPNDSTMIDPHEKILGELKKLTTQSNRNVFLSYLGFVAQTFSKVPGIHLQTLDFRNQQMSLQLVTATFDTLEKFIHELNHFGVKAKQQNASTSGNQIKAMVLIQK